MRSFPGLRFMAVVVLAATWLHGCGGGGGGGGASEPPIAETAAAYWNAESAGRWAYTQTDSRPGHPSGSVNLVKVAGTSPSAGHDVVRFGHSHSLVDGSTIEESRYFDGTSIHATESFDAGSGTIVGEYAELPAPLRAGTKTTTLERSESIDIDGDATPDTLRIVVESTLALEPTRTVPAGTFSNVVRARNEATATVESSLLGRSFSATSVLTVWYAPGVGPIRREFVDPEFAAPANVAIEELSGVSLVAKRSGIVPGFVAFDSIGLGNVSDAPGMPALASDGSAVLVVTPSVAAPSATIAGAIVGADDRVLWTGTVIEDSGTGSTMRVAAAFDGGGYQVFWARPSDGALVGRRLAPSGVLAGPVNGTPVGPPVGSGSISWVGAASDGAAVLLVWQRFDAVAGQVVEAVVVDRNGAPVSAIAALPARAGVGDLAVASSGGRYLVVSSAGGAVEFVRVDASGALVDDAWQAVPGGAFRTAAVANAHAGGFLVGWVDWVAPPAAGVVNRVRARRLDGDGNVSDATDLDVAAESVNTRSLVTMTTGTQGAVAAWTDESFAPVDTAQRASVVRALPGAGAPDFGAAAALWYTQSAAESLRAQYPASVAAGDRSVVAWIENRESPMATSDRVVYANVYATP